jgi:hypothetical protein
MRELVVDAWTMVVLNSVALSYLGSHTTQAKFEGGTSQRL